MKENISSTLTEIHVHLRTADDKLANGYLWSKADVRRFFYFLRISAITTIVTVLKQIINRQNLLH